VATYRKGWAEERKRKIENSKRYGWLRKHGDLSMEVGD
jgi:hypothetical protein